MKTDGGDAMGMPAAARPGDIPRPGSSETTNECHRPRISIVTPSYQQAAYIEQAIRSVVDQNYADLEYIIIDGGSKDGTVDIIRKYESRLTHWTSEPDNGQYDALNKGFAQTSGEIMAWLNSDDMYTPWAFAVVAEIFATLPQVEWITTLFPMQWDKEGRAVHCRQSHGFTRGGFFRGEHLNSPGRRNSGWIQQESTFWRRSLWERAGGYLNASLSLAGDFDLWARFYQHTDLIGVRAPLAGFRLHGDQKTAVQMKAYIEEAQAALKQHGGRITGKAEAFARFLVASSGKTRRMLSRLGLIRPRTACEFDARQGKWTLVQW